jgi:hypothetical protein
MFQLLKSEPNQLIGLILLRTTSEELMGLHSSFENGRKDEITRLLYQYIPMVFDLLNSILENLGIIESYCQIFLFNVRVLQVLNLDTLLLQLLHLLQHIPHLLQVFPSSL